MAGSSRKFADLKEFIKKHFDFKNCLSLILIVLIVIQLSTMINFEKRITKLVKHYYLNTTKSLEVIHGVKLDRYNGDLYHELSTQELQTRSIYSKLK